MNLKEAFRYQNFLTNLSEQAYRAASNRDNQLSITKTHHIHDANPDAEDKTEAVVNENPVSIDACIGLMSELVTQREKLTAAIAEAKSGLDFSMDAVIAANKARQSMAGVIRGILRTKASETQTTGTGYKFNTDGVQQPYVYEITVAKTENFDRAELKKVMDEAMATCDQVSSQLDTAMVNTQVNYSEPWNVNATFDDILEQFMTSKSAE